MPSSPVRVVHLVAKTHLDLGFTALASEVVEQYVTDFFPRAIAVANQLRDRGGDERLVWTTGSWILREALERQGSAESRRAVCAAVERGDLAWHGLPVTTHTELLDADLFRHGLSISQGLDERFGRRTSAAKMTDVPGHTRSMVPLLAEAGISFLHLGVNPAWPVPEVPPVFRWQVDDHEVVVAYSAGGYGRDVVVDGYDAVLSFLHSGDNLGPPSADEVVAAHAELAERYPGAEVRASTLTGFADDLATSNAAKTLPIVTAEIGDPWLFGAGSDPQKVSAFLSVSRAIAAGVGDGSITEDVAVEARDSLLLVGEHTWGLDEKEVFPTEPAWDDATLAEIRASEVGKRFESSWAEQRSYVRRAASVLGVESGLDVVATEPDDRRTADREGFEPLPVDTSLSIGGWTVRVDPATGALAGLVHDTGRTLADTDHRLGLLSHQTFSAEDYERFYAQLQPIPADEWWATRDNMKPGIEAAGAVSDRTELAVDEISYRLDVSGGRLEVIVQGSWANGRPGAPENVELRWSVEVDGGTDGIGVTLTCLWPTKPPTRLPEATWLSFSPAVEEPERWLMDKLGRPVSPLDVVARGGRSLHAVGHGGVTHDGSDGRLAIHSDDAPLMAPGRPNLLDADPPLPEMANGWHVLLHDNCWGTNFPMWNEGPASFTVRLSTL